MNNVCTKQSAIINSESYLELSGDIRKVKMQIIKTNMGPEPVCHEHKTVNNDKWSRKDSPMTLTGRGGTKFPTIYVCCGE